MELEPEIAAIESDLRAGRITWESALTQIVAIRSRRAPWQTSAWKNERKKCLGSSCEQCGSSEPPLVLQHFWHPHSFAQNLRIVVGKDVWKAFKKRWDDRLGEAITENRDTCPKCSSLHVKPRKRSADWKCYKCGTEFARPDVRAIAIRQVDAYEMHRRREATAKERWQAFVREFGPRYGAEAIFRYLEESRVYLSFNGVATFCQRCAFLWDKRGLRLCVLCKERYHQLHYANCLECESQSN